jgi:hypothetical protein
MAAEAKALGEMPRLVIKKVKTVPILINFRKAEIGAAPITFLEQKDKIGAVKTAITVLNGLH